MTAQTTIRARRVNANTATIGTHLTLTKVVNDVLAQRHFGFAVTDEGEEVYIPASIVRNQQMTDHDVGAGFHAILKDKPGYEITQNNRVCVPPIKWDGEAEEITVEVAPEQAPVTQQELEDALADLDTLGEAADDMLVDAARDIRDAVDKVKALDIPNGLKMLEATADKLEAFRAYISEMVGEDAD